MRFTKSIRIGDDASLNDIDVANTTRLSGQQNADRGFLQFGNGDANSLGRIGTSRLQFGGYNIQTDQYPLPSFDNRNTATTPQTIDFGVIFNFKNRSTESMPGTSLYSAHMTFRPYGSGSDFSGGPAHQLGFNGDGGLSYRYGSSTTWNAWRTVLDSSNFNSYSPTLTGLGASGTWPINITGNAATLAGYAPNQTSGANTIVQRDSNGYIQNTYFYSSAGGSERNNSGLAYFNGFNSGDYYMRSYTPTAAAVAIQGVATGTWNITSAATNSVAWSNVSGKPTALSQFTNDVGFNKFYDGWVNAPGYDANTIAGSKSGFTYSNNAPFTGPMAHFDASGYGFQFNAQYGDGNAIAFRVRNGDNGTWNNWKTIYHSGNFNPSLYLTKSGDTANEIYNNGWYRSNGQNGWYSETYGGGIHMTDSSYVRVYGNKGFISNGPIIQGDGAAGNIFLTDDESTGGNKRIHANSNLIGYLDGSGNWINYYDHSGQEWTKSYGWLHEYFANKNNGNTFQNTNYFLDNRGNTGNSNTFSLQAYSNNGAGACMSFHRGGHYAINLGLDSDNIFRLGGWSAPANVLQINTSSGNLTALGSVTATTINLSSDTTNRFQNGALILRGTSPTVYLRDTDNNSAMLHCNSNLFYILRGGNDTEGWSSTNGYWPAYWDLTNNNAIFGGALWCAGDVTAFSDEKVKTNWTSLDSNIVNKLANIKSGTFDRTDINKRQVGVSAQSLQEILPEAVSYNEKEDMLSVSYGNAALALCVELAKKVVELEKKLNDLTK